MANDCGIGTYIRNTVPRIMAARPEWRFTLLGHARTLDALGWKAVPNAGFREVEARIYSIREQLAMVRATPRDTDLLWVPHFNIPVLSRHRLLVTVHDVAHLALPQFVRGIAKQAYARTMFAAIARQAGGIVCDSDFTRRELHRHVPRIRERPAVVHLGVGREWHVGPAGERPHPRPYVLYVGNVKPHKNIGALVRAFAAIAGEVPHDFVIVGRREGMRTVDTAVQAVADAMRDRIRFTGEVPGDVLRQYVAWADALALASFYEGFGLPPLEAMAAGCPTLVSRAGSLPEVCGDASLYCDPHDVGDVARQLQRILTDRALQDTLRERGRAQAARFTWERCAEETLDVLERTLAR